jgi:hypothetical protein
MDGPVINDLRSSVHNSTDESISEECQTAVPFTRRITYEENSGVREVMSVPLARISFAPEIMDIGIENERESKDTENEVVFMFLPTSVLVGSSWFFLHPKKITTNSKSPIVLRGMDFIVGFMMYIFY